MKRSLEERIDALEEENKKLKLELAKIKKVTVENDVLTLGGVPEHFNIPISMAIEEGIFEKKGVKVVFKEINEGTGAMCTGLREGTLDVAILLTEGIVKDIAQGNQAKIVGTYVQSPLTWAIVTGPKSPLKSVDELFGKTIGIRSHLMSFVLADEKGWMGSKEKLFKFSIQHNFGQLRKSVQEGEADAFLWETFMCKPYIDKGELKKIGEIKTPWPCFMIAARKPIVNDENKYLLVKKMMEGLSEACDKFVKNENGESVEKISKKCNLTKEDSQKWLDGVVYAKNQQINRSVLVKTVDILIKSGILPNHTPKFTFHRFYDYRASVASVSEKEIETMKLFYTTRVRNELKERNRVEGPLNVNDLKDFDQFHYHGSKAVDEAAAFLKLGDLNSSRDTSKRVFEIGSGVGGPSRYMAYNYGCEVTAIEINQERNELAVELTKRCNLHQKVEHVCADINQYKFVPASYDHFVSWLSILHIEDRNTLFQNCFSALKSGATFVIEDFVKPNNETLPLSVLADLKISVACPYLPTFEEYKLQVEKAGFVDVKIENLTNDWTDFVVKRVTIFEQQRVKNLRVHGREIIDGLGYFYAIVANLFANKYVGGIRVTGRKP